MDKIMNITHVVDFKSVYLVTGNSWCLCDFLTNEDGKYFRIYAFEMRISSIIFQWRKDRHHQQMNWASARNRILYMYENIFVYSINVYTKCQICRTYYPSVSLQAYIPFFLMFRIACECACFIFLYTKIGSMFDVYYVQVKLGKSVRVIWFSTHIRC